MTDREFWQQVLLTALNVGYGNSDATEIANEALADCPEDAE